MYQPLITFCPHPAIITQVLCIFEVPKILNMNELERMKQLSSARKLKEREETPVPFADPYSDMTPEEKSKMIIALMAARERDAERI